MDFFETDSWNNEGDFYFVLFFQKKFRIEELFKHVSLHVSQDNFVVEKYVQN